MARWASWSWVSGDVVGEGFLGLGGREWEEEGSELRYVCLGAGGWFGLGRGECEEFANISRQTVICTVIPSPAAHIITFSMRNK